MTMTIVVVLVPLGTGISAMIFRRDVSYRCSEKSSVVHQ